MHPNFSIRLPCTSTSSRDRSKQLMDKILGEREVGLSSTSLNLRCLLFPNPSGFRQAPTSLQCLGRAGQHSQPCAHPRAQWCSLHAWKPGPPPARPGTWHSVPEQTSHLRSPGICFTMQSFTAVTHPFQSLASQEEEAAAGEGMQLISHVETGFPQRPPWGSSPQPRFACSAPPATSNCYVLEELLAR